MICYRDRVYCSYHAICNKGWVCDRALTDKIRRLAVKADLPISQFIDKPHCFVALLEIKNGNKT